MPGWTDFVQYFDKAAGGKGNSATHLLGSKESVERLAKVDNLLDESIRRLSGIQGNLNARQFKIYRTKHNQLYLMVVEVKTEIREPEENAIFFLNTAEKEQLNSKIQKRHKQCKAYHTDIITASRRVYEMDSQVEMNDPGALVGPASAHQLISSPISSKPSGSFSDSAIASFTSDSQSTSHTLRSQTSSGEPIVGMVTGKVSPENKLESSNSSGSYTVTVICSSEDRDAIFKTSYHPAASEDDNAERRAEELFQYAIWVMESHLDDFEGCTVVEQFGGSWLSAVFSSLTLQTPDLTNGSMV